MRIAIVEDNTAVAQGIEYLLSREGHAVDLFVDGQDACQPLIQDPPDLLILDINLPGMNGLDLLRAFRGAKHVAPVLLLTARADTDERVAGLDAGADDYLVKPFEMPELAARIRALLRRRHAHLSEQITVGPLAFDKTSREILLDGERQAFPRREVALFEALALAQGRLVPKERLLEHVYGTGADVEMSAVEVQISRLRKRLLSYDVTIRTVRGFGYLMERDT